MRIRLSQNHKAGLRHCLEGGWLALVAFAAEERDEDCVFGHASELDDF